MTDGDEGERGSQAHGRHGGEMVMEISKIELAALMKIALCMTALAPKIDSHGRQEWMALLSVLNDVIARAQKPSPPGSDRWYGAET